METIWRFCPSCAGTLEMRLLKRGDPERHVCTRCGQVVYQDPKVAVGTIISMNSRIVLVRRAIEPGYGKWVFPGGYVDRGEEVTAAAIREAKEEAGLDVRLDRLINIYSYAGRPLVVVVYAATAVGGRVVHRRRVPGSPAVHSRRNPVERARVCEHGRRLARISRRRGSKPVINLSRKSLKNQLVTAGILLRSTSAIAGRPCVRFPAEKNIMTNRIAVALLSISALVASGCIGYESGSNITGPSASGANAFLGNWTSTNIIPSPTACTDFKWDVSEQTGTSAKGNFSATCAGELKLTGTAQGNLTSGTTLNWSATGNATAPGLPSCSISLTGTAELLIDTIRVPYSGDTCLGKVSGIESLKKR